MTNIKSASENERELFGDNIEHFCRFKSLDFYRFYSSFFIEFETENKGYKIRLLSQEQAEQLNKELKQFDNPLTAANYIVNQVLSGRYT
jgi:hypothetical protein